MKKTRQIKLSEDFTKLLWNNKQYKETFEDAIKRNLKPSFWKNNQDKNNQEKNQKSKIKHDKHKS